MSKRSINDVDPILDRALAVNAARRFYLEDQSKVQIADELGVSRFKVARLLESAREWGIVNITIADDGVVDEALSAALRDELGLQRAVVVGASGNDDDVRRTVGRAAATLLTQTLQDGETLGMGWGRTLGATAEAIDELPRISVVQLTGATEMTPDLSPVEIVRRIGLRSGGDVLPLFAPLVADDVATARAFRNQSDIARVLERHEQVTTAVMAVGSWNPPSSQLYDVLAPEVRQDLVDRGAVAEIGVTMLDSLGREMAPDFADRCVGVTTDRLRATPRVIAVAASAAKSEAVLALARSGLISELVVDSALAGAALALGRRTAADS